MSRRVHTLRAALPAAATVLALALSACSNGPGPGPDPEEPEVKVAVPAQFDNASPAWKTISDVQGETQTAISADGRHYAYAYRTGEQGTYEVGQVDLATGERVQEQSVEALTPSPGDGSNGDRGLMFSGNRLILIQAGESPKSGAAQWSVSIFPAGRTGKPKLLLNELADDQARVSIPSSHVGPLVAVTPSPSAPAQHFAVDPERGTAIEVKVEAGELSTGCGGSSCDLQPVPVAQVGMDTVATWEESRSGGRTVCSKTLTDTSPAANGFDGCLRGFGTQKWSSQDPDVAPKGAVAKSARLYAVGGEHVVGAWQGKDGGTIYRTINVKDPRRAHAVVTCEGKTAGTDTHRLAVSASGKHLVAGSVLFDAKSGKGRCFEGASGGADVRFMSVDDAGTAWGATGQSGNPLAYMSEVVSATAAGGALSPAKGQVALPLSFMRVDGRDVAAFVNSGDAKDGTTVLAAYPRT